MVEEQDEIQGQIVIKRNPYWRRHLKVTFDWWVTRRGIVGEVSFSWIETTER